MIANRLLLVRPLVFGANAQTQETNAFQRNVDGSSRCAAEFDSVLRSLEENDIEFHVFESDREDAPDALFPNNWVSTFPNGLMVTYPMMAPNRRIERSMAILAALKKKCGYSTHVQLEYLEDEEPPLYLEGTGSLVVDHTHKLAFAALSPRTHAAALRVFEQKTGYRVIEFHASGPDGKDIYHTNVMMAMGEHFVAVGLETVAKQDKERLCEHLVALHKAVIPLSNEQIFECFSGNMLQVLSRRSERCLLMSAKAARSLNPNQKRALLEHNDKLIAFEISTIEAVGGGSIRCMLTELF